VGDATIRIKLGSIEIDYQGDATFLKNDLLETIKALLELQEKHPEAKAPESRELGDQAANKSGRIDLSTDTIANVLGTKTGPDLVIAAAAHLHFTRALQKFTREQLLAEMRSSPGHYKKSYQNNLWSYLTGLTKKDRLRSSGDSYSLSSREAKALGERLAKH
jgi:hypothetical protein